MILNKLALVMGLLFAFNASANLGTQPNTAAKLSFESDFLMDYQMYSARRSAELEVLAAANVDGQEATDFIHQLLFIPEGFTLTMVDQSADGTHTTIALDLEGMLSRGEDISGLPSLIKVKTADLNILQLEMIELGPLDAESGLEDF